MREHVQENMFTHERGHASPQIVNHFACRKDVHLCFIMIFATLEL